MKNAFYVMLKALFVLEIFTFLFWPFGYVEKWLDEKAMVNFKTYGVTDWQKIVTIHILHNISRSKGNQTIECVKLIKHSVRIILLQKSCRKWGRETSPRPLFVIQKKII